MGSMITLGIGRMEIDWGKNSSYRDYSALFQIQDIKLVPYYYANDEADNPVVEMKEGFSRILSSVKVRLDLLGYDITSIRGLYEASLKDCEEFGYEVQFSFDDFYNTLRYIDIPKVDSMKISIKYDENGYDLGEYVSKCILEDPQIKKHLPVKYKKKDKNGWNNAIYDLGTFFENLDPCITLRVLAENPNNQDLELQWNFADVVEGGWAKREDFVSPLSSGEKILIVTEGSSDSYIIKRTIESLYPDIADFFDFIDMEENYPFTGVGNLYNFCLGLVRINVGNKILVIFDNDTAGVEKYQLLSSVKKPDTFLITKLPNYDAFSHFQALGPQGESYENINGKAVAIECFLDLNSVNKIPAIRWTSYNKKMKQYQGELVGKDDYVRAFKNCDLTNGSYDSKKLRFLIDYILSQWTHRSSLSL
ncbi:HEPN/Toprim-associated domain-containing protein [Caproicibacterium sp. NSD3]